MTDIPAADRAVPRSHNQPPILDRIDALATETRRVCTEFPEIQDQATADRYAGFLQQIRAARADCEAEEEKEKRPHLNALTEIRARWGEPIKLCQTMFEFMSGRLNRYLQREREKKMEATRKANLEAAEKEAEALQAARLAQRMQEHAETGRLAGTGVDPLALAEEANAKIEAAKEAAKEARAIEKTKIGAGAQYGARNMHLRTIWSAEITDVDAALLHFKGHTKLVECLQKLCDAAVRSDHLNPPPGCKATGKQSVT